MIFFDMFGERIEPVSTGLHPTLPLLVILNATLPPIKTLDRPNNLDTRPKTCLYDPPSKFLGCLRTVSRRYHRAVRLRHVSSRLRHPVAVISLTAERHESMTGTYGEDFLYSFSFKPGRHGPDAPPLAPAMRSLPLRSASAPGGWRATR